MQLFQQDKSGLIGLKEKSFKLEKDIQKIVECNLEQISGYRFVKSEFAVKIFVLTRWLLTRKVNHL